MKFKAELRNIRTFSKLVAALSALDKVVWVRLESKAVRFVVIPDRGSQVWALFSRDFFFDPDTFTLQSKNVDNAIDLEVTLASLQRALRSALNSTDAVLKLTKRDDVPVLSMTIHTMTNPRGLGAFGFGPISAPGGGGGGNARFRESTFGSTFDEGAGAAGSGGPGREESLELLAKSEREKVVLQDMPVRVMKAEAMKSIMEPVVPESDVNIELPPLMQLKAVSDRFTKLAAHTTSSGSGGLGLAPAGFSTAAGSGGNSAGGGGAGPKLEISANMYGMLRLRLMTDALSVETVWNDLENPVMNEDMLTMPLEEHPSTRYREAGPEKFATVRVDGRDWSRVLSVGRLDGARVIACVIDSTALVLHVYVSRPDDPDDFEDTNTITHVVRRRCVYDYLLGLETKEAGD
ncbi:Checkpoint protein hus1 [Sporothrix epigloea]|uniref:Checkpoint protein n=1 Tax=Sporothrix epigloea TaxID=1892477 RepID=A0ABP0DAL2_9PEZI